MRVVAGAYAHIVVCSVWH